MKDSDSAVSSLVSTEPAVEVVPPRAAARRLLRAETFYLASLVAFSVLAAFSYYNAYFGWDLRIAGLVQSLPISGLRASMRTVSLFGNGWIPYLMAAISVIVCVALGLRSEAVGLVLSSAGGGLLNTLLKTTIARPRPVAPFVIVDSEVRGLSFPSGHVMFYVCYFGFLFFAAYGLLPRGSWLRRIALTISALPVVLIGISRVFLGAHWPSDTLGAYLAGGIWLAFSLDMYRRLKARETPEKT